jgi:hypothetical protein
MPRIVHIFFSSAEKERIIEPIEEMKADKLYIFLFKRDNVIVDQNIVRTRDNVNILKSKFPSLEVEEIGVPFTDYYLVIEEISKIIIKEVQIINEKVDNELKIKINVSTGAKMSAIACMDAIRVWPECFLSGYYAYSEDYDHTRAIQHIGKQKVFIPPVMNFTKPKIELIKVIKIIYDLSMKDQYDRAKGFVYNQELLERLKAEKMIEPNTRNQNQKNNESGELMSLKTKFISPLEKAGYIEVLMKGRTKVISLTEEGMNVFHFYKTLITIQKNPKTGKYDIIV